MKRHTLFAVATMMVVVSTCYARSEKDAKITTLKNLEHAYQGESDANQFYSACAQKADQEGYHQVASLFRAAAYSETIHAKNHAEVIRQMGAQPKAELEKPKVKSTRKNLNESYKDEKKESTKMYPEFIKQAQAAGNNAAARTFTYAQAAEAQHAKYFKEALDNLEKWRTGQKAFFVCTACGYTTDDPKIKACPVCSASDKFQEIK